MTAAEPYRGRHSTPDPEDIPTAPAAPPPPVQEWVAYTPPVAPPPPPPVWELPPGFVPLRPPRRTRRLRVIGAVVAVALVAALGWFGYRAMSQHHTTPAALTQPDVGPASAVTYTSPDGHFRVGLASQPHIVTQTTTFGGYSFKTTIAADAVGRVGAGGISITPDAPAGGMDAMLRGFVTGLQRDGGVSDIVMGSYEGHQSVTASVARSTGNEVVLAWAYSPRQVYLLIAPDQTSLTALEGRFQPLP